MKIKHSLVFVLSTLLLGAGSVTAVGQSTAPTAPAARPSGAAKETPLSQKERQELQQRREQERIQKAVDNSVKNSSELRNQVQAEVNRTFGFTTSLLNLLLGLLILFPIAGIIALWLLRRNLASQIKTEVKQELGQEVKAELVRSIHAELEPKPQTNPSMPSNNGENVGQLKELISMAMATQNLISETRHTLEESANSQAKAEQLLKDVFERSQQPPTDRLNEGYERPEEHSQELFNNEVSQPPNQEQQSFNNYQQQGEIPTAEPVTEVVYEPYVEQTHNPSSNDVYQRYETSPQVHLEEEELDDRLLDVTPQYSSNGGEANPQEIIVDCERAIQGNYEDYEAWCAKGVALSQLGRFEEALAALNKSLQFNSEFADAWYEKARCYALQGKTDSALENLRRSIHLNPNKKQMAKTDAFFNSIRQSMGFEEMVTAG